MTEQSYGFIPFYKGEQGLEVFLIHQYGSEGETLLWTFPKGRGEEGETPIQTAIRELKEETSLTLDSYDDTKPFSVSYTYHAIHRNVDVQKTSTYFIGYVSDKEFRVQPEEVKEAGWFSIEDAREKLTFPTTKKLFDEVLSRLDKIG